MISERAVLAASEPLAFRHLSRRAMVRQQLEAALPFLTQDLFAWVHHDKTPAILFFDASVMEMEVLAGLFAGRWPDPILVPVIPSAGRSVKDCVLAQSPAELRRLLYAANGEHFIQSLSENCL